MTAENYDELTNMALSEKYSTTEFGLFPSDFLAAFAYWVTAQNTNGTFIVNKPLEAYSKFVMPFFENPKIPTKFTFQQVSGMIHDTVFENIPEILELNEMEPDFIDLEALARNVFFMVIRAQVIGGYFENKKCS